MVISCLETYPTASSDGPPSLIPQCHELPYLTLAVQLFDCAIVLDQVMRQSGEDDDHATPILQHPTLCERRSSD